MKEKVCAVIVTYNRKTLLKRCLQALVSQTRPPDEIVVVNNAGTDGTPEMLRLEFPDVQRLDLAENLGGAGGYHYGIKWAYENGFQWISVMDDDGWAASDYLQQLLAYNDPHLQVKAPLVLSECNSNALAFKLYWQNNTITTLTQAQRLAQANLIPYINPFNGILISSSVVTQIGLPEKGLFLWGDEYEYFLRMKYAGIGLGTIITAHFYHPPNRMQADSVHIVGKKFSVYYADNPLKDYLILRNHAYILKKYRGWLGWAVHIVRYLIFYGRKLKFKEMPKIFKASFHGARSDFSHHRKFLT